VELPSFRGKTRAPGRGFFPNDEEQLATLERLTERYCVVYQTLASTPGLTTAITQA
jgi:hypothetical protein